MHSLQKSVQIACFSTTIRSSIYRNATQGNFSRPVPEAPAESIDVDFLKYIIDVDFLKYIFL